ncbi:MAG TPA: RtcB family protein [Gemmatimonadota bacterium]|nr:RtcB family protein [Gemmatimonadota bacterium]
MEIELRRMDRVRWKIPRNGEMRVDGLVYADDGIMETLREDQALRQVANVATLPGIVKHSLAMPDIHWGYGFPIGGVAAFDEDEGVISPGGVGYDINCGVRLLRSDLEAESAREKIETLVEGLFHALPSGVGSHRSDVVLDRDQLTELLVEGAGWLVERGWGREDDLESIEAGGRLPGADPGALSERALSRGTDQVGTLGSGNHFAEVQAVEEIYDADTARAFGLEPGKVALMIHSGSRGLGYQVCDDYLETMLDAAGRYGIELPDRQLCCAPLSSEEGKRYLGAMAAAANYAFSNRQMMAHKARNVFGRLFGDEVAESMRTVYDVCHNIAKLEEHEVDGARRRLCVHRKGATRAFPAGHPELPERYRETGQPVLVPGDMGRYSYVAVGTPGGFGETFGSSCHGAGRLKSRTQSRKDTRGRSLFREFRDRGIFVRSDERSTVAEEVPEAYKDVKSVMAVVEAAGIGRPVARLRPLGVVKG